MSMNQFSLTRFSIPSSDSSGGLNLRLRLYESLNGAISLGAKAEIKKVCKSEKTYTPYCLIKLLLFPQQGVTVPVQLSKITVAEFFPNNLKSPADLRRS